MSPEMNQDTQTEREAKTLSEALGDVRQSLMRAASSLIRLPLSGLPKESRSHFEKAGSEINQGVSALLRSIADGIASTRDGDDADTTKHEDKASK